MDYLLPTMPTGMKSSNEGLPLLSYLMKRKELIIFNINYLGVGSDEVANLSFLMG